MKNFIPKQLEDKENPFIQNDDRAEFFQKAMNVPEEKKDLEYENKKLNLQIKNDAIYIGLFMCVAVFLMLFIKLF